MALFHSEKIATVLIDQFENTTTAARDTGERFLGHNDGQAGFFHDQAIQIA